MQYRIIVSGRAASFDRYFDECSVVALALDQLWFNSRVDEA